MGGGKIGRWVRILDRSNGDRLEFIVVECICSETVDLVEIEDVSKLENDVFGGQIDRIEKSFNDSIEQYR